MNNSVKIVGLSILLSTVFILMVGHPQQRDSYIPGLGEIMGYIQVRHAKLALAGEKENWQLADYELDELQEGLDDLTKFHPTHEKVPMPTEKALRTFMDQPLRQVREAITQKNATAFATAVDSVTASCNACHTQCNFGFIHIQKPNLATPYSSQDYAYKP